MNARSSNAKVNKSIKITRETSIISQKIERFGGRPPVDGRPGARPPGPPGPPLNPALDPPMLLKLLVYT